jgi:hypothetical protein
MAPQETSMASLSLTCLMAAAMAYHVPVPTMQAIRTVEGGQQGQEVCQNYDGSCDLGPFQVNDKAWVGTLASALHADRTAVRTMLRDDGCWNAQVASWIMHQEMQDAGGDERAAIGNYNSHYPSAHDAYLRKVSSVLQSLSPSDAPPAMPGTAPGDSPGALRIPPDVSGAASPLGLPEPEAKGKMIRVRKPASHGERPAPETRPDAQPDASAPDASAPDAAMPDASGDTSHAPSAQPAAAPKIYRGAGGGQ